MNNEYAAYVEDMEKMPAPTNEEIDEMLNDMWRQEMDRLEEDWEMDQEYKFRGMIFE
jgi:hypothetical protein